MNISTKNDLDQGLNLKNFSLFGIMLIFLIILFPSVSFFLRYFFEFFILFFVLLKNGIKNNFLKNTTIIFLFLLISSLIHFLETKSAEEIFDLIRITTPLLIFSITKNISNSEISFILKMLILVNIFGIYYFETIGDTFGISDLIHTRDLEESYGRHSGFFLNVSSLGAFATISIIFSLVRSFSIREGIFKEIIFILLSGYLLLMSGSKTGMALVMIFSITFILYDALIKQRVSSIVFSILIFGVFLYFLPFLIDTFYQLEKLFMVFDRGLLGISSFSGRITIWTNIIELFLSSPVYFVFGIPKETLNILTTTFDNDYIWVLSRYGIFALLFLIIFITSMIVKMYKKILFFEDLSPNFWCFLLICSYSLFIGIFTTPQLFSLSCLILAPFFSSKYSKDS